METRSSVRGRGQIKGFKWRFASFVICPKPVITNEDPGLTGARDWSVSGGAELVKAIRTSAGSHDP